MTTLLSILDVAITVSVTAVVWTLLAVGVVQFVRESIHQLGVTHRQVARSARS